MSTNESQITSVSSKAIEKKPSWVSSSPIKIVAVKESVTPTKQPEMEKKTSEKEEKEFNNLFL